MGIKGIYRELGPGRRVSLAKLAADSFERADRPLRIAIDVAIWQFQTQAAQGGVNPAIRTLFYRLVRLLATPVQPLFVFDGPKKPALKRNKRSGRGDGVATAQAKCLIRLFGFAIHDAPGEAEAECALLQTHGIVDAVLSEDVDTIMFGCTKTLRNWSAESKSSKTPTHISLYDVHDQSIANLGLGREGMVLVALMSGGDYLPEGIPGCGVKVACEAAKAGFGRSVCRLKASDEEGMRAWKASLKHELKTNDQGHFRTKHKALVVPDDFPSVEVLRYYTHPVVSQLGSLDSVREKLQGKQRLQLDALREFARETFGWDFRVGAIKFIRVLGQALLVHNLCQQEESHQVKSISGRRTHFSTDATPELRMAFIPSEVVPIDLSKEVEENVSSGRDGLALNSDDDFEPAADTVEAVDSAAAKMFDVTKPELAWVLESVAKRAIPKQVQEWEAARLRKAACKPPAKSKERGATAKRDEGQKMLDGFFRIVKGPGSMVGTGSSGAARGDAKLLSPPSPRNCSLSHLPPPSPRQESKQSLPRAVRKPATSTAPSCVVGSSPMTPRLCEPANRSEAILVSSSPVRSPTRSESPCKTRPGPRLARPPESTGLAAGGGAQRLSRVQKATKPKKPETAAQVATPSTLKQSSMDAFFSPAASPVATQTQREPAVTQAKRKPATTGRGKDGAAATAGHDDDDLSDLETLSSLLSQARESVAKRQHEVQPEARREAPTVRWSDVSVIDLTEE